MFLYIIAFITEKSKREFQIILIICLYFGFQPSNNKKGGDEMAKFFTENQAVKAEFDKLPVAVKNSIIESGVEINSVEELKKAARSIKENM